MTKQTKKINKNEAVLKNSEAAAILQRLAEDGVLFHFTATGNEMTLSIPEGNNLEEFNLLKFNFSRFNNFMDYMYRQCVGKAWEPIDRDSTTYKFSHLKPILSRLFGFRGPYRELIALSALGYEDIVESLMEDFTPGNIAEFIVFFEEDEENTDTTAIDLLRDLHDSLVYNTVMNDGKKFYVFGSGRMIMIRKKSKVDKYIRLHYYCEELNQEQVIDCNVDDYQENAFKTFADAKDVANGILENLYAQED
jgi:hypothetical protein